MDNHKLVMISFDFFLYFFSKYDKKYNFFYKNKICMKILEFGHMQEYIYIYIYIYIPDNLSR